MKPTIEWLARLLAAQAPRLDLDCQLEDETVVSARYGRRHLLILSDSAEYWALPANAKARNSPDLFLAVSWRHNSVLPCPTLSLSEGYLYAPFQLPHGFAIQDNKLTKKTSGIFLGALLAGVQEAYDRLAVMPRSTRQRYERKLRSVIVRRGRPRRAA